MWSITITIRSRLRRFFLPLRKRLCAGAARDVRLSFGGTDFFDARYWGLRMSLKWKLIWPASDCALRLLVGLAVGPVPGLAGGHARSGLLIVFALALAVPLVVTGA